MTVDDELQIYLYLNDGNTTNLPGRTLTNISMFCFPATSKHKVSLCSYKHQTPTLLSDWFNITFFFYFLQKEEEIYDDIAVIETVVDPQYENADPIHEPEG